MQTKKGFILIYTILIGIICLAIMMSIFDIYMAEVKYSISAKRYILNEDSIKKTDANKIEDTYQKDKEYLMTLFLSCIDANSIEIKAKEINKFFPNSTSSIVTYGKAKVTHPNSTNEFIFTTPFELSRNREDYYNLAIIDGSFEMVFIKTERPLK